ncbi:HAD-IA family hydrolase [Jeotgalibacillus sp. R-1-5s-1]|uniref:HAD-IA family hydrolase n=1 Tax=Jeotgalibacillus sp. R-1-5s-1 TaxID=2555897 RepID=UPI00106C328D|nr:HAD-IA family hydrolase [Jeotgalibacillus sp. R-1-5s-1]TFD93584.1 HAD family hydrolase [Jeotgalibacillus sp. R-1-5s-1]
MNILWDFDGTLFDTYPAYSKRLHDVLVGKASQEEAYTQLKISASHALNFFDLSNEERKTYDDLTKQISPDEMVPFNGVEAVLKSANKNVIMTHKDQKSALEILDFHGFTDYFTEIVTIDHGFPRKPDPASYQYLHERHHIDLAIGDRELDIIPAKKLGIATCLFQNDSQLADYHLENYHDFFRVFKNGLPR